MVMRGSSGRQSSAVWSAISSASALGSAAGGRETPRSVYEERARCGRARTGGCSRGSRQPSSQLACPQRLRLQRLRHLLAEGKAGAEGAVVLGKPRKVCRLARAQEGSVDDRIQSVYSQKSPNHVSDANPAQSAGRHGGVRAGSQAGAGGSTCACHAAAAAAAAATAAAASQALPATVTSAQAAAHRSAACTAAS